MLGENPKPPSIGGYTTRCRGSLLWHFHLVEDGKGEYPFAFLATYSSVVSKDGKRKHLPLKNALIEYRNDKNHLLKLLSTVNNAAEKSSFITGIVDSGEIFHAIGLIPEEAYLFLKEVPIYEEAGILCRIPDWWRNHGNSYKLNINIGSKNKSRLNYDAIVDFNAELMLNGERVNADELKQMLSEAEGLRLIKGKWVEVNHDKLRKMLDAYDRALEYGNKATLGIVEAIRFQLDSGSELKVSRDECEIEITNGMWLNDVIGKLMLPDSMKSVTCSSNFCTRLRPYQQTGLNWLNYMKELGLGACLADDMGLGKTVQVIALIDFICHRKKEKTLLVIPASLIGNWVDEIKRFAPLLRWQIIHPSAQNASQRNSEAENTPDCLQSSDIFITTYGMLLKYEWLKEVKWDTLVIDEAQAIKNPGTKQTHAVKSLKAASRIALTGTPVENRLSDLWSLFDFLNKGLLGSSREFSDFSKKIKESSEGYARLKKAVSPFILRRLKTDKSVISDLPEKIEIKSYASLTKKQVVLYEKLVDELTEKLTSSVEGIERKGLVLASLLKLKQICNHPDQYLGQKVYDIDDSGKFIRLKEICEIIRDNRERALIFTQFKEITDQLKNFLENIFRHEGLVLHGGTAVGKRKGIVEKFQGKDYIPFIVLSIKAGGVGLNLTAANHVIHFDRWWNPAVENQATDRAFRIGQNKNVIVHKFITKGTIEEKIDLMIEDKIKLFRNIVPESKESWITELDNNSLIELFKLR